MADRQYYEIAPGYGAPGIADARRKFLAEVERAAGIPFRTRKGVTFYGVRRTDVGIVVDFDRHTHLQVDFWDHFQRRHYGFEPKWYYSFTRGGDIMLAPTGADTERQHHWAHAMRILDAIRRVVVTVTLVPIT